MHTTISTQKLLQALQEPALLLNPQGKIQQVNDALVQLLDYSADALQGQHFDCLCQHPSVAQALSLDWQSAIPFSQEWLFHKQDGEALSLRCSVHCLVHGEAAIYLVLLIPRTEQPPLNDYLAKAEAHLQAAVNHRERDLQQALERLKQHQRDLEQEILERQAMEQQLLAAKAKIQSALDRARELSDLKTRFIATASHEFRTPLSSILSSAALIERYTTAEQQHKRLKHVNRIKSSVNNLTHILEDFLSLSSLEEGKAPKHVQEFDLKTLVKAVLSEVNVMAKAEQQLHWQHEGDDNVLRTNAQALKNILLNLLSNAIKYSPVGASILITTKTNAEEVHLSIQDNGMGIPKNQQKYLFSRFFRADNATAIQGTGLGLYIVKKYLEGLEGSIEFESKEGTGTTFYVRFPKNKAQ
jgi:signal transduction histidine kinase